jgi:hypothetical protein
MSRFLFFLRCSPLACHFQRTVISTQAIGMVVILGLTLQSYLDLRALRDVTNEATKDREPNESQAEVLPLLLSKTRLHKMISSLVFSLYMKRQEKQRREWQAILKPSRFQVWSAVRCYRVRHKKKPPAIRARCVAARGVIARRGAG